MKQTARRHTQTGRGRQADKESDECGYITQPCLYRGIDKTIPVSRVAMPLRQPTTHTDRQREQGGFITQCCLNPEMDKTIPCMHSRHTNKTDRHRD